MENWIDLCLNEKEKDSRSSHFIITGTYSAVRKTHTNWSCRHFFENSSVDLQVEREADGWTNRNNYKTIVNDNIEQNLRLTDVLSSCYPAEEIRLAEISEHGRRVQPEQQSDDSFTETQNLTMNAGQLPNFPHKTLLWAKNNAHKEGHFEAVFCLIFFFCFCFLLILGLLAVFLFAYLHVTCKKLLPSRIKPHQSQTSRQSQWFRPRNWACVRTKCPGVFSISFLFFGGGKIFVFMLPFQVTDHNTDPDQNYCSHFCCTKIATSKLHKHKRDLLCCCQGAQREKGHFFSLNARLKTTGAGAKTSTIRQLHQVFVQKKKQVKKKSELQEHEQRHGNYNSVLRENVQSLSKALRLAVTYMLSRGCYVAFLG